MDTPSALQARSIVAHTAIDGMTFRQMAGHEGLSQLFEFEVELLADNFNLDLKQLLGKPLSLEMATTSQTRYLSGQVVRCVMVGRENSVSRNYIYKATVKPWLWYLTQTSDNKIFQQKNVPDIIKEVLGEYGYPFEIKLTGNYRSWEYCVQYQETDFAFISRLMEHEGIYYYFKHDKGQHTLVLTDDVASHSPMPGYDTIPYYGPDRISTPQAEYVSMWEVMAQVTPDGYATVDYDFTKPGACLDAMSRCKGGSEPGNLEMFEWQGGFQEAEHGEHYARVRLEELQSNREQTLGLCNVRGLAPGHLFTLRNHPRNAENREYMIVTVNYRMSVGGYSSGAGLEEFYEASFSALPTTVQYRAPRTTPIPRTHGPQTARVVGPAGEELWTDQYGRIKVQFHWDRYGQKNESSSCWVRVSSPWAGGGFGGLQLPRINDEVVVDFIGGCPDRPLVLGRVYNANNMPPVELPARASQSGFRSQSVHGDPTMCNMMIFDDELGNEIFHTRAQKDMKNEIINDHRHTIGRDHCQVIGNNHEVNIGHDHSQTIGNNHAVQIGNNLKTIIDAMEERLVKAEQRITINSNAIHNYDSNFNQRITGVEDRVTMAEQKITVHSNAIHEYKSDMNEIVTANKNLTVQANKSTKVLGDMSVESNNYKKKVGGASFTQTIGLNMSLLYGGSVSLTPASVSTTGLSTSFTGASTSFTGATKSFTGKAFKTRGQKTDATLAENRLVGIEKSIKAARSNVSTVSRIVRGVKSNMNGLTQETTGLKSQVGGLDTRVNTLESHA